VIERHQDYLVTIPSVPVGGVQQYPIKLDTDAPFALRLVRSRGIGLNGWRFTNPRQAYQSNALRTDWIVPVAPNTNPNSSRGAVISEQMIYEPGSSILVDVGNSTDAALTNAQLLFRGSKLYKDGSLWMPTYPPKCSLFPAVYQVIVPNVGLTSTILNNVLSIKNDADFVFQAGVCDAFTLSPNADLNPTNAFQFTNLFVTIRDESYKAYSNAPIHVNDLFGQGLPDPFQTGSSDDDQVLFTPGLITPEIYIPRRHNLYFDVTRNDEGIEGFGPVDLYFRFIGWKVFER
jgi:hypothetical protein